MKKELAGDQPSRNKAWRFRNVLNRRMLSLCLVTLSFASLFSREPEPTSPGLGEVNKNSLYIELMGNNGTYSINYERLLFMNEAADKAVAVSAGFNLPFSLFQVKIPMELKYIQGTKHCLELGTGLTLGTANWGDAMESNRFIGSYAVLRAGYRYTNHRLLIRAAPMLHIPKYWSSAIWGGVSVGYSF